MSTEKRDKLAGEYSCGFPEWSRPEQTIASIAFARGWEACVAETSSASPHPANVSTKSENIDTSPSADMQERAEAFILSRYYEDEQKQHGIEWVKHRSAFQIMVQDMSAFAESVRLEEQERCAEILAECLHSIASRKVRP